MNIIFMHASFFLVSLFHFHRALFSWACGSLCEPRKFSLFVHSPVCPITHSFLDGFQPNLVQHYPQVCSTCHTIFSLKKTLECVCERLPYKWKYWRVKNLANQLTEIIGVILIWRMAICVRPQLISYVQCALNSVPHGYACSRFLRSWLPCLL